MPVLGLEEPRHDLEFKLTSVGYDRQGNAFSYHVEPVSIIEVTEDRGDHSDKTFEEIKENKELLRQLEPLSEEQCDDPPRTSLR